MTTSLTPKISLTPKTTHKAKSVAQLRTANNRNTNKHDKSPRRAVTDQSHQNRNTKHLDKNKGFTANKESSPNKSYNRKQKHPAIEHEQSLGSTKNKATLASRLLTSQAAATSPIEVANLHPATIFLGQEFTVANASQEELVRKAVDLADLGVDITADYINNPRFLAALCIKEVLEDGRSLNFTLANQLNPDNKPFISELAYGVMRYLPQLNFIVNQLLELKIKRHNYFANYLLLCALYQLIYMRRAEHAVLFETVELVKQIYNKGFSKMINGILRNFLRREAELVSASKAISLMPKWLTNNFSHNYPTADLNELVTNSHGHPPLWLRVNLIKITVAEFTQQLEQANIGYLVHEVIPGAVKLTTMPAIERIPGYHQGWFSVQDLHAQLAAHILNLQLVSQVNTTTGVTELTVTVSNWHEQLTQQIAQGKQMLQQLSANLEPSRVTADATKATSTTQAQLESQAASKITDLYTNEVAPKLKLNIDDNLLAQGQLILDACAAPGGKTTHLQELAPNAIIIASELDAKRISVVHRNQSRLQQLGITVLANAAMVSTWLPKLYGHLLRTDFQQLRVTTHNNIKYNNLSLESAVSYHDYCVARLPYYKAKLEVTLGQQLGSEVFDKILLDVPCSAIGVIRRHPDIKWLRSEQDIQRLQQTQLDILADNWSVLKPGGLLLYATCSILQQENSEVIQQFLAQQSDAQVISLKPLANLLTSSCSVYPEQELGLQLLPGNNDQGDGFYYCLLYKQ